MSELKRPGKYQVYEYTNDWDGWHLFGSYEDRAQAEQAMANPLQYQVVEHGGVRPRPWRTKAK